MDSAKSPRIRLLHMRENISGILDNTSGLSFETIAGDYLLIRATDRGLQIISEAAKELPAEIRAMEADVPWQKIIGIGNYLRHEYYGINESDLRSIVQVHLPALQPAVERLLKKLSE